jgi:hypothetical protein
VRSPDEPHRKRRITIDEAIDQAIEEAVQRAIEEIEGEIALGDGPVLPSRTRE